MRARRPHPGNFRVWPFPPLSFPFSRLPPPPVRTAGRALCAGARGGGEPARQRPAGLAAWDPTLQGGAAPQRWARRAAWRERSPEKLASLRRKEILLWAFHRDQLESSKGLV